MENIKSPIKDVARDRTVGVDLSTMRLADGDVSVWDFGGQLEYAVTHQMLLSVEVTQRHSLTKHSRLINACFFFSVSFSCNRWSSTLCAMICQPLKRCKSSSVRTGSTSCNPRCHHHPRTSRSGECLWSERRVRRPIFQRTLRIPCHHGSRSGPTSHSMISTSWCHHTR